MATQYKAQKNKYLLMSCKLDAAAGGAGQSADHFHAGGFPGTVSADKTVNLSPLYMQAHSIRRQMLPVPFGQILGFDNIVHLQLPFFC